MSHKIAIERLTEADIDALFEFRNRVLPANPKRADRARWQWLFKSNPANDCQLPVWVLKTQGRITGSISAIVLRIRKNKEVVTAYHGADFFVEQAFKGLPALRLVKTMMSHSRLQIGANMSESARKLFAKLGYIDLSPDLYSASIDIWSPDRPVCSIRSILSVCVKKVIRILAAGTGYRNTVTHRVPEDYGKLWQSISASKYLGVEKDSEYLSWRYEKCPKIKHNFIAFRRNKRLCALVITGIWQDFAKQYKTGLIFDILVPKGNIFLLFAALSGSLEFFKNKKCMNCSLHWSARWAKPVLRALGFHLGKSGLGLMVWIDKKNESIKTAQKPGKWLFSLGDTDRY